MTDAASASDVVRAVYYLETPGDPAQVADVVAGEMSCGTFTAVPGETAELVAGHRARLVELTECDPPSYPSLPSRRASTGVSLHSANVTIEVPIVNFGVNLPTLLSTVAGNIYELGELTGLRLLDLSIPAWLRERFPKPQFGVAGTRELVSVRDRPLIGTIIKPSVGLRPAETAGLAACLAAADIDFIKDDELMANPPHSPLSERVQCVMRALNDETDRQGRRVMYAFNISDDLPAMLRHHDTVVKHGGTCVMVSLNSVGLTAATELSRRAQVPVHGHRNGWGVLTRHPALGMDFRAYQKLWRLTGIDHLHTNGLGNKFWEPDASVVASIRDCLAPMSSNDEVLPVLSSGQWAAQLPETFRQVGSTDFLYLSGGGILAHPDGPAAGVASLHQSYLAARQGSPLETFAASHAELRRAIEQFGPLKAYR